ncbi:MAG: SAM-dependent methyltransferase [Clostridiales bacterium]|nr:SAM-dependent methyltransferase [Clostridiales bacterium]
MSKLSKRLNEIYYLVSGGTIADVGCDHGKLASALVESKKCLFAYVSDISKPSLEKAEKLLSGHDNFRAIHCDGLQGYVGSNVDECIISGMGGEEIIQIISSSPIDIPVYILSPQKNEVKVKEYMSSIGYGIVFDKIIKDKGKFYHIFRCEKGAKTNAQDELDLYFGRDSFEAGDTDFIEYLDYESNKTNNILDRVDSQKKEELIKYLDLLKLAKKRNGKKL